MAVPKGPTEKRYTGNGVTKIFTIPFLLLSATDLDVLIDGAEVISGFVITGVGNPTSTITFTVAPADQADILLTLDVPFERLNDYQENGDFLSSTVNRDFDRIWQALKQLLRFSTRALSLGYFDVDGSGFYRAKGNGITGLASANKSPTNATNYQDLVDYVNAILATGQGPVNNAANILYISPAGTVLTVQDLSNVVNSGKGIAMLGYAGGSLFDYMKVGVDRNVPSIAALRLLSGSINQRAFVTSYWGDGKSGGGHYSADLADMASVDDGGACIVGIDGTRWKLVHSGCVSVTQFGARIDRGADATDAFQRTINYVEASRGKVKIPDGNYKILGTVLLPNFITIEGESIGGTVVGSQLDARSVPCFANKDPANFMYVTMCNFSIRGGTRGIEANVTAGTERNNFYDIAFALQTIGGYYCNKLLQTTTFRDVIFDTCFSGITCAAFTANHNSFERVEFINLVSWAVRFISSEVNNFIGCRFEIGGQNGNVTLSLVDARNCNFWGCYFERTHNNLLIETSSANGVYFKGCHFTGALDPNTGDIIPYVFTSDGVVEFGSNSWYRPSDGPARMLITGDNGNRLGNNNGVYSASNKKHCKFSTIAVNLVAGTNQYRIASFGRFAPAAGNYSESQLLVAQVAVTIQFVNASGVSASYGAIFPVAVSGVAASAMSITVGTPIIAINTGALTVALAVEPGPTSTQCWLLATVSGATSPVSGFIQATVDTSSGSVPGFQQISVSL